MSAVHRPTAPPDRPPDIPPFAAWAVSAATDPVPSLHPDERQLVSARMVDARRTSLARGRAAAHAALRTLDLDRGPILSGPDREPRWPEGAVGSISHAAGHSVALAAPATRTDGVGVDIEVLRDEPELWRQVPTDAERRWLSSTSPGGGDLSLIALFSAKESIYKAFFPRRRSFFGFADASLTPTPLGYTARLAEGVDATYTPDRPFAVGCRWYGNLVVTWVVLPRTRLPDDLT